MKLKLHILLHILEDVRTHGPGILNSTETFEAFNVVFRGSSIFSNHLAPSRDIANSSAVLESYKHVVSGGWWSSEDGSHVRAGFKVRQYFTDPQVIRQLGIEEQEDVPGMPCSVHNVCEVVNLNGNSTGYIHCLQKTRKVGGVSWSSLNLEPPSPEGLSPTPNSMWYPCQYVVSQHSDRCRVGSWVFANRAVSMLPMVRSCRRLIPQTGMHSRREDNASPDSRCRRP